MPFPNLWSDPLSLSLDTLNLDFTLTAPSPKGKSPETASRRHRSSPPTSPSLDLASSVTSAADDFLHEELDAYEEAELDRSIRQSLILNQTDPFIAADLPGAFPGLSSPGESSQPLPPTVESTTVLAGLVARVLARLEFRVKDVRIRVRYDDPKHGGVFELRIGEVRYADETGAGEERAPQQTVRAVKLSGTAIYMLPLPSPSTPSRSRFFSSTSRSSSTSSTSTTSTTSSKGDATMYMSQAVADLRQSTMSGAESDLSIYQSALSERAPGDGEEAVANDLAGGTRSRSVTPTAAPARAREEVMLVSFGSEDVICRMRTTQPVPVVAGNDTNARNLSSSSQTTARPQIARSSTSFSNSQTPALGLELSIGTIAALILPSQAASVLGALQLATQARMSEPDSGTPPDPVNSAQPRLDAKVRIRGAYVSMVYDMKVKDTLAFHQAVATFWTKPATTHIPFGHLKLRLEGLEAAYSTRESVPRGNGPSRPRAEKSYSASPLPRRSSAIHFGRQPPVLSIHIADMSLFEYLASEASNSSGETDPSPPGGAFPVLIFDTNIPKQYAIAPGAQSVPLGPAKTPTVHPQAIFPEFDSVDWRNSGLQRKSGGGEKAWKVRQKGRGVLKSTTATTPAEDEGSVISVRKDMSPGAGTRHLIPGCHCLFLFSCCSEPIASPCVLRPIIGRASSAHASVHRTGHSRST